jgi:hypothetical protein
VVDLVKEILDNYGVVVLGELVPAVEAGRRVAAAALAVGLSGLRESLGLLGRKLGKGKLGVVDEAVDGVCAIGTARGKPRVLLTPFFCLRPVVGLGVQSLRFWPRKSVVDVVRAMVWERALWRIVKVYHNKEDNGDKEVAGNPRGAPRAEDGGHKPAHGCSGRWQATSSASSIDSRLFRF